jgi:hypothetical protein
MQLLGGHVRAVRGAQQEPLRSCQRSRQCLLVVEVGDDSVTARIVERVSALWGPYKRRAWNAEIGKRSQRRAADSARGAGNNDLRGF